MKNKHLSLRVGQLRIDFNNVLDELVTHIEDLESENFDLRKALEMAEGDNGAMQEEIMELNRVLSRGN